MTTHVDGSHFEKVLLCGLSGRRAGPLAEGFAKRGAVSTLAFDVEQVVRILNDETFDLVACDRDLVNGESATLLLSLESATGPVLILGEADGNGRSELDDLADVAIPADSTVGEIVVAGTALLGHRIAARRQAPLRFAGFELDVDRRQGSFRGEPLELTKYQFRLLAVLLSRQGAVVTRRELDRLVFDSQPFDDGERVTAHIRRIRKKIETDPSDPEIVLTVRGEGYRIAG